jgi:hypothetical protein
MSSYRYCHATVLLCACIWTSDEVHVGEAVLGLHVCMICGDGPVARSAKDDEENKKKLLNRN